MFKKIINVLLLIIKVKRPLKTIIINFRLLPFKQAIRFPILIYGGVVFRSLTGKMIINSDKIRPGMFRIGSNSWHPGPISPCILTIDGTLIVEQDTAIGMGTYILIAKNATLSIGNKSIIGSNNKIICYNSISFGKNCRIPWETQFTDTSFHYVEKDNEISSLTQPIILGNYCWIGNRSTISKGTILPDYSIVASNSIVNKDFSNCGKYCFYAGSPAKLKGTNIKRIFDSEKEKELDIKYSYTRRHL